MNIAVYCSSRQGLSTDIEATALALGTWIGQNGHTLVYGGVNAGLMHTVAQAAHDAGAQVVGSFTRGTNAWVWPSKGEARCIASDWGNDGSRIVISPQ